MYKEKGRCAKDTKVKKREKKIRKLCVGGALLSGAAGVFTLAVLIVMAVPKGWTAIGQKEEAEKLTDAGWQKEAAGQAAYENVSGNELLAENPYIPLIVVDAGHGGEDDGCVENGIREKEINLEIGLLVKSKLEEKGFRVLMPRSTDEYLAKEERVELANSYQADAYISIHQNTYEGSDKSVRGIETWYDGADETRDSGRLARLVHGETIKSTGAVERELQECSELCVVGKSLMPACLIETGFLSNPEESSLLSTREYQEKIAEGIAEGVDLYFNPKTMYLTFDDGPSAECTEKVLDVLKEKNVKATFFLIGEYVEKYPEVARRIAAEGHTIGIHCYCHDYEVLYESKESFFADFQKAYEVVYEVTGVKTKLFRFPGGSVNSFNEDVRKDIIEEMTKQGFIYFDWNASLEDAAGKYEPEQLIENARYTTLERKRIVMLAHDRVLNTALCLGDLIEQFPEYRMEPITDETEPVQFRLP